MSLADLDRKIARIVLDIPHPAVHDYPLSKREGESYRRDAVRSALPEIAPAVWRRGCLR